ncbi:class I SAM-dependent methyltransferase [Polaromonas sp.]|jgi:cyclopropane-fatty-acyl-phospholipid synthase|uniref:class I SAM-dependent methyltransferase n=1 Tax=Polaromonas sp. TaxID=1869339 RepID=UPI002C1FC533|nr:class I SAM-dependent methyltransferase [Polaromonas sp.]HQS30227.1 class I SAM-dependent methyltransferase [Polaromonas sp.]HQS89624.1 class I SAM-dependent methyltransferase [Polaromonas sp.]
MIRSLVPDFPSKLSRLPADIALQLPRGEQIGPPNARVKLSFSNWSSIALLKAGQIGALAEDYVEGKLQLEGAMRDVMRAMARVLPGTPLASDSHWWASLYRRLKAQAAHTPARDAAQIQFHYDVSDDFYALWLDPRRVYSCAYYSNLADASLTLTRAQEAKLDLICRKLMLQPGERFLDVGAGWGGLLLWAAEHYGVDATGITLSKNQHAHAQALITQKGLAHRVRVELCDYRDLAEDRPFDKIASVGMFEHVGRVNMTGYFEKIMRLLAPGGLVMNHGITAGGLENAQLGAGMGDFIEKYIFPGGELMHVSAVLQHLARAGLEMVDSENLRPHYARTLWDWSDALEAQLEEARQVLTASSGSERAEKTLRAYRLYLAGSAMSFQEGWLSLHQLLATRPTHVPRMQEGKVTGGDSVYPFSRDYMYR